MSFRGRLKESFVDGILLLLPFVVVVFILDLLVDWATVIVNPVVRETRLVNYTSNIEVLAQVVAGVFVLAVIIVLGFVYSSERSMGWRTRLGKFVNFIPLFGTIYMSVRQVAASIGENESRFRKLVLLEYPRENIYSLGLLTSEAPGKIQEGKDEKIYSVFLPNSPNPTGGRTVMVPENEIEELDMSVQKGLKLMLTTGIAFEEDELPEELSNV